MIISQSPLVIGSGSIFKSVHLSSLYPYKMERLRQNYQEYINEETISIHEEIFLHVFLNLNDKSKSKP